MTTRLPIDSTSSQVRHGSESSTRSAGAQLHAVVDQQIAAARRAAAEARTTTVASRLRYIRSFRENLAAAASHLPGKLAVEIQRPPEDFLSSEIVPLLDACRFLEKNASRLLKPRRHAAWTMPLWLAGTVHHVLREPLGVVLIVGPSNYPFFLPGVQVLQALAAGNAVLLKPGPYGVKSAEALQLLLSRSGLPSGHFQLLPAAPESVIHAIGAKVDKVFLTGSVETGRKVLVHAAAAITPAVVELSGCDAVFILPDANLDLAAECIAFGLTLNSGRTCIAPRRAFVWPEVRAAFTDRLQRALAARPAVFAKCKPEDISEMLESGTRLIHGSIDSDGTVTGPLVLDNVPPESSYATAENWGPNLSIFPVNTEQDALAATHRSPFRLGASIFSKNRATAERLAHALQVGSVCVNDLIVPTADGRLPFGGRMQSGFGSTRGPEGLLEMTTVKVISTRGSFPRLHLRPSAPNQFDQLSAYAALAYGSPSVRWRAIRRMISLSFRRSASTPET